MSKSRTQRDRETALRIMLDGTIKNFKEPRMKKVTNLKQIYINENTCNYVYRTKQGILKVNMPYSDLNEFDQEESIKQFKRGRDYLETMSNFFPNSYAFIKAIGTIKPTKKDVYFNLVPNMPRQINYMLLEEIKGQHICDEDLSDLWPEEKLDILIKLCNIVGLTHKLYGVINCDIKNANVILKSKKRIEKEERKISGELMEIELEKREYFPILFDTESFTFRRQPIEIFTPEYLPPETARIILDGRNRRPIEYQRHMEHGTASEKLDIYATAVVAYEFLTGKHPSGRDIYEKEYTEVLEKISRPIDLSSRFKKRSNQNLVGILQKAFDLKYEDMNEFATDLRKEKERIEVLRDRQTQVVRASG